MSSESPRIQVAVVGAGLGGLLLALFLQRKSPDIQVDIYESASKLTELGVGIGMWPRSWEIIRSLGLEEELRNASGAPDGSALPLFYRKADELEQIEFYKLNPVLYTFHRSVLQKILSKHVRTTDRLRYHFSKRLASYTEPKDTHAPVVLRFKDGSSAHYDVLVGSDGIHSAVRRTMYTLYSEEAKSQRRGEDDLHLRKMIEPIWSGQVAYRGLAPAAEVTKNGFKGAGTAMILLGKDKHIVSYPISRGEAINVVAFVNTPGGEGTVYEGPWVSTTTGEDVAQYYSGWEPSVQTLCKHMENPLCWAVHTVRQLPTFVKGKVAIIGDAAHAMTPHQGAGASQALEDGFILATLLAHPRVTRTTLPQALTIFDEIRRPFAQEVQARSRTNGLLYELNTLGWERVSAAESARGGFPHDRLVELGRAIERQVSWSLAGSASVLQDQERALEMLAERLGGHA